MARITISLKDEEKLALRALAEKEFRDPRAQATLIIRQELERRGLLTIEAQTDSCSAAAPSMNDPKPEGNHAKG